MFYTVSIPHQRRASASSFDDRADFIASVYNHADCFVYGEETRESLIATFGDVLDEDGDTAEESYATVYPSLVALLAANDKVIEVKRGCNDDSEYFAPGTEPSEFDVACEVAGDDLHAFYTFDSLDEMVAWAKTYGGHQDTAVRTEVMSLA